MKEREKDKEREKVSERGKEAESLVQSCHTALTEKRVMFNLSDVVG